MTFTLTLRRLWFLSVDTNKRELTAS